MKARSEHRCDSKTYALNQGSVNYSSQAKSDPPSVFPKTFYWKAAMLIHSRIVIFCYGCCFAKTAMLKSCNRYPLPLKAETIYHLGLYRKFANHCSHGTISHLHVFLSRIARRNQILEQAVKKHSHYQYTLKTADNLHFASSENRLASNSTHNP